MIRLFLLLSLVGMCTLIVFAPEKKKRDIIIFDLYRSTGVTLNISS